MKKILYVAYGGGHINMILELYNHLKANPQYEHIIFGLTAAQIKLNALDIPYVSYLNYVDLFPQAIEHGKLLSSKQSNNPGIQAEETFAYLGVNFCELVHNHGLKSAQGIYEENGRFAFFPLNAMKAILSEIKPDIVVSTSSPRSERAALAAAKELGIPSICLVDLFDVNDLKPIVDGNIATRVCVLNQYTKNIMEELGRTDGVVITGNPAFDHIFDSCYIEKARKYREEKKIGSRKMLLWARSCIAEDIELANKVEMTLFEFARVNPNFVIVLRPHPNEPFIKPDHIPDNLFYSLKNEDLYTVLHAADVLYTLYSTVGVEAYLIGKQILQQTNTNTFKRFDLVEVCGAIGIADLNMLAEILERATSTSMPQLKLRTEHVKATDKIAHVIATLLEGHDA